jgi:4-carboxymuconolactone decarboxylase
LNFVSEPNHRLERGKRKREEISGSASPGTPATQELAPFFSSWVLESVFGELWSRPALGDKTRVLITLTALAVREQPHQLKGYVRSALRTGWTREEIVEAIVHLAPYAGVPAVHNALAVAKDVFDAESDSRG